MRETRVYVVRLRLRASGQRGTWGIERRGERKRGAGAQLEHDRQWQQAIELYLRGLDADGLTESFYRGLMRCHQSMGRRAEALSVYRRMRQTLSVTLGIKPSPESEALHASLLGSS